MSHDADPSSPTVPAIGPRLRRLRTAGKLSLAEVAARTGVSEATMSRIETGHSDVSAPHLFRLAVLFGVDIGSLFHDDIPGPSTPVSINRRGQGRVFDSGRVQSTMLFTDTPHKRMHPFFNLVRGQTLKAVGGLAAHGGDEYLRVHRGRLVLHVADRAPVTLAPGDSAYFDATQPHAYVSADPEGAEFLVVCTSDHPHDQKGPLDAR